MKEVNFRFLYIVFFVFLTACGNDGAPDKTSNNRDKTQIESERESLFSSIPVALKNQHTAIISKKISYLFIKDKRLVLQLGDKQTVISNSINSEQFWLKVVGSYVHVFWWDKFGTLAKNDFSKKKKGKVLYASSSSDGGKTFSKPQAITQGGGVLPNVKIVADEKGHVTVVYLDERYKGFQIFSNSSQDGGVNWKKEDYRLDHSSENLAQAKTLTAVSPNIVQVGNDLVSVWEQPDVTNDRKKILRVYSRVSHDFGRTWEKQTVVYETREYQGVSMSLFDDGYKNAFLFIPLREKGVMAFVKTKGNEWTKIEGFAPNSEKAKINNYFKITADDKYLYVTYIFVEKANGPKPPWHVELVRIDKNNNNWVSPSFRLDSRGMGVSSRGGYQDIITLEDGTIVVVWEDYRRILPMIALNYTVDQGKTWLNTPMILSNQNIVNTSIFPFIKKNDKDRFTVFFLNNKYPEQVKPEVKTLAVTLDSPQSKEFNKKALSLKSLPSDDVLKKRLTERFKLLKDARLHKKWKQAWKLRDPIYRNMYKKSTWLRTRDRLIYKSFDLKSLKLEIPYASTSGKMVYDLDPDFVHVKKNDPRFSNIKETFSLPWGWFVDDWYIISEGYNQYYLP